MQGDLCESKGSLIQREPDAAAEVFGNSSYPNIHGTVKFYQTARGVLVYAVVCGLPESLSKVFGFHIHEGSSCTGNDKDSFADAGSHYDLKQDQHPHHAGDLPPLFGNEGLALLIVLTDRFTVNDVVGKTVIIHDSPDDFTTQPSGNAGKKIACGVIRNMR